MRIAKRLLCSFLGLLPLLFPLTAYGQGIEQTTPAFNSQTTGNSPVSLNPVNTVDQGSYVIINNESTNSNSSEYSGTFLPAQYQNKSKQQLKPEAYRVDVNKPFDIQKNKNNRVKKNYLMGTPLLGDSKSFWVTNFVTNSDYQITAQLLYSGTSANVWVNNNQITQSDAAKLGAEFDNKIHPTINKYFGNESDVDGDGKVNILVYDIQDGFSGSGGYIGGYFYSGDLYYSAHSNHSEIFYMDTYPSMGTSNQKDVTAVYPTLAHEFQHMVNFNENTFVENNTQPMDTWLDEGLSMAAEQVYTGQALTDRIDYYNTSDSIANGQSLLYWDDYGDTLANYSLSYLFSEYLRIQAKQGNGIFKEILNDPNNDYKAVEDAVKKYIDPSMTFGQFTTDFREALLLKQPSGLYGFNGESAFNALKPKIFIGSSTQLRGGGAVIKAVNSGTAMTVPSDKGLDITYRPVSNNTGPDIYSVNQITDQDTTISGTTNANVKVIVSKGSTVLGSAFADDTGNFIIPIAKQKGGTTLTVYAQDADGNKGQEQSVIVIDTTPPAAPSVNPVGDNQNVVTGKAEPKAKVIVKTGSATLGQALASSTGSYSVPIKLQKAGTKIVVHAQDPSGNKSAYVSVTVLDKTPPAKPAMGVVGDNQTILNGKTEVNATVVIKLGAKVLGQGKAGGNGTFTIKIPAAQKAGTSLSIFASDSAGNTSLAIVKVVDKTPPAAPTAVGKVTSLSTIVSGKAESGSTVYIYNGTTLIGKALSENGNFKAAIKAQKKGTTLEVIAMDAAYNQSKSVFVIVN